jgi:O-antigen ligase
MVSAVTAPHRTALHLSAILAASVIGMLAAARPGLAIAAIGGCALVALAVFAPVFSLVLLLFLTAIVPYGLQNRYSPGGGPGSPGLLPSDVLLLAGLARAALVLPGVRLSRHAAIIAAGIALLVALCAAQFVHGVSAGHAQSDAGAELRTLLAFGVALIALPTLLDAAARERLFLGLCILGLLLGLWGIAQWVVDIPFSVNGDVGVRQGVRLTTAGRGQVQGGLYGFPVAAILALAALLGPDGRSAGRRALLLAVLMVNCVSALLTYERTFWVATLAGFAFVAWRTGPGRRARILALLPAVVAVFVAVVAVVAPREATAARERLLSLGQYGADASVTYRVVESSAVLARIRADPVAGSGLGASILWAPPFVGVRPASAVYSHNGYLWLAWKLGLPGAALVLALLAAAILSRGPPTGTGRSAALRAGAQASLLALLCASVTFPSFNTLSITAVMGLLVALCAAPDHTDQGARA